MKRKDICLGYREKNCFRFLQEALRAEDNAIKNLLRFLEGLTDKEENGSVARPLKKLESNFRERNNT